MFCRAKGEDENAEADMSAEARRWCPLATLREEGGRRLELDASGVLFRLPMI